MIEDMTIRKFAQKTQHDLCNGQGVRELSQAIPDTAKPEDVRGLSVASDVERCGYAEDQRHRRGTAVLN
jgi:hypothetical protein